MNGSSALEAAAHKAQPPEGQASHGARVEIARLEKTYGSARAVAGIDLSIESGEFVTLLGPSGSGKTTILMAMAGFVAPSAGDIWIDGESMLGRPAHKRSIGMVFQNYALFPHMTVAHNIAFPLKMRRWSRRETAEAVRKSLALVQLEAYGDRYPVQLSGGQQQRVALARATVYGPRLLLMDEPLGALDRQLRQAMQFELLQIQRTLGVTVVSVTHDQEEALTMSDRVVILNEGRIEQVGSPLEVYERPRTRFVAGFVGEANLLEGRVTHGADGASQLITTDGLALTVMGDLEPGSMAVVSIRPESFEFCPPARLPGENILRGRVVASAYTGGGTRYQVAIDGGQELIVRADAADTPAGVGTSDEVAFFVKPSDIAVVDEQADKGGK